MPKLILSLLLIVSIVCQSNGQITLEPERDSQQNVTIYAVNTAKIPYSVIISFSDLQNMTVSGGTSVTSVASPGRSKVATLKPTVSGQSTNFRYSYSYAKGSIYSKSKLEPVYLIPVAEGVSVRANVNTNISKVVKSEVNADAYVGVSFHFEGSTTIVAPRKGVIADMKMDFVAKSDNLTFTADENFIEIYHEDGTLTKLIVLKSGSEKVQVGDEVLPGQALAESGGEHYQNGIRVMMVNQKAEKSDMDKFRYIYFPVTFVAKEGNQEITQPIQLTAIHPAEIVTRELSKKELKAYQEGN